MPAPAKDRPKGCPAPADAQWLTIDEVAAELRVCAASIRRLVHGDDVTPPQLDSVRIKQCIRISRNSLNAYLAKSAKKAGTTTVSAKAAKRFGIKR